MSVSIKQAGTASVTSGTSLNVSLPAAATAGDLLLLVVAAGAQIAPPANFTLLQAGSPGNPALQAFLYTSPPGGGPTAVTVTTNAAAPIACYFAEMSASCVSIVSSAAQTTTSTPSLSASTPPTWLVNTGDLPLAFFTSLAASNAMAQSGWTNLCTLNSPTGNVLNGQSGPAATSPASSYTGTVTWGATNPSGEAMILSANSADYAFTSQGMTETIGQGTPNSRTSQMFLETVDYNTSNTLDNLRTSQMELDVIGQDTALARSSQMFVELIIPLVVHSSQEELEILGTNNANARSSQVFMEVLFSSQGQRRRVVDDEMFTY